MIHASVTHHKGTYSLILEMQVEGDAETIRRLLTDFDHLTRFNDSVADSQRLTSPDPEVIRARIVVKDCISFFCATLVQVQEMHRLPNGDLLINILPKLSDYSLGTSLWHIAPEENGSARVRVEAVMAPKIWIPPLLGPVLVSNLLEKRALGVMKNLEVLAMQSTVAHAL